MYLNVTKHDVQLAEPDVFTDFHAVTGRALTREQCDSVLRTRGVGEVTPDGDHVLVTADAIRRLVAGRVADGWEDGFSAMLAYADKKGWLTSDGSAVRVHIEDNDRPGG